jgi:hypothetical protein
MPQLKIVDVKKQVEELEAQVNAKFEGLVNELKQVLQNAKVIPNDPNTPSKEKELEEKVNQIKKDLVGHVEVYNKHIRQLHIQNKGQ